MDEQQRLRFRMEVVEQFGYAPWEEPRSRKDPRAGRKPRGKKIICRCGRKVLKLIRRDDIDYCAQCEPSRPRGRPPLPPSAKAPAPATPRCGCGAESVYASGLCEECKDKQLASAPQKAALTLVAG